MSELRPETPTTRPASARLREDDAPAVDPPSSAELASIERQLVTLPRYSGGVVTDEPELGVVMVRSPMQAPGLDYAAMPRWTAEGWRASLDATAERMRADGRWPSLLLADRLDRPIGMERELPGLGWSAVLRESVLWVGRASIVPHLDPSLRIEAVQPRSVAAHEELERRVFGLPEREAEARRTWLADALGTGEVRAYVVRIHDEPVAVARLAQGEGVAGIYGVGVAASHRRTGLGTLITTVATRAGMALGDRLVWLSVEDGNDGARLMYERLGFQPAFRWSRWMRLER